MNERRINRFMEDLFEAAYWVAGAVCVIAGVAGLVVGILKLWL